MAERLAARVSDEKCIRGVVREMCYTNALYTFTFLTLQYPIPKKHTYTGTVGAHWSQLMPCPMLNVVTTWMGDLYCMYPNIGATQSSTLHEIEKTVCPFSLGRKKMVMMVH